LQHIDPPAPVKKKRSDFFRKNVLGKYFIPEMEESPWLEMCDKNKIPISETTKLQTLKQQVHTWLQEAPREKIIIFVQWRRFAILIGRMLQKEQVGFVYYSVRGNNLAILVSLLTLT